MAISDFDMQSMRANQFASIGSGGGSNGFAPVGIFASLGISLQDSPGFLSFGPKQGGFWDKPMSPFASNNNKPQGMIGKFLSQITADLQQCGAMPQIGAPTPADFSMISPPNTPSMVGGGEIGPAPVG